MKITGIDTVMIDSPGRTWTIVRVYTDEGITGLGEATYSNKEPVVCAAVEHMKQELIGRDPARIEYLWHHIFRQSSLSGIWRDEIIAEPLVVEEGSLLLPRGPGLGVELDMDGVERHRWRP